MTEDNFMIVFTKRNSLLVSALFSVFYLSTLSLSFAMENDDDFLQENKAHQSLTVQKISTPHDEEVKTLSSLLKKGEKGDVAVQYMLGFRYSTGTGVKKDKQEAVKWFTMAAEQGFAQAQVVLNTRNMREQDNPGFDLYSRIVAIILSPWVLFS